MKSLIQTLLLSFAFSHPAWAEPAASRALVAHNVLHKVGQLIGQNKLDATFSTNLQSMVIGPSASGFVAVVRQVAGADQTANTVTFELNAAGKVTAYNVTPGTASVGAPAWPGKDALELTEEAVHHVAQSASDVNLAPFSSGLATIVISQTSGTPLQAVADVTSSEASQTLRILLATDGKVISTTLVDAEEQD